jgi:hypothetical protein
MNRDEQDYDSTHITCKPRPPRERETPSHARATRAYIKGLERHARRDTKRLRRHQREPIEQVIWGRMMQDAYLTAGWVPLSEQTDRNGFTKMTMRLDP